MHTKGPLRVCFDGIEQDDGGWYRKAKIYFQREHVGQAADDARLLEQAPEMAEALRQVLPYSSFAVNSSRGGEKGAALVSGAFQRVEQAISQAEEKETGK